MSVHLRNRIQELSFIAALQLVAKFRGLILVPLMLRVFGAATYGIWVQLTVASSFFCGLSQANLHSALLRYLPTADHTRRGAIFWNALTYVFVSSAALAALVSFVASGSVARHIDVPQETLVWLGLLVLTRSLNQFVSNVFRADGKGRTYAALEAIPSLTEVIAVAAGALWGRSLYVALVTMILLEVVGLVAMFAVIVRSMPASRLESATLSPLLRYSLPGIPVNVSNFVLTFSDRYIIAMLMGSEAVGIYSAAYAVSSLPSFLVRPLAVVLIPRAAKAWDAGNRDGAVAILRRHIKLYIFIGVPAVAGLAVLGPQVLSFLAGKQSPQWTLPLFLSVGSGSFLFGLLILGLHAYLLEERVGASAWLYVTAATVNVLLNFWLIPGLGIIGAGIATAIAYGVACVFVQINAQRSLGILISIRTTVVSIAAATLMAIVVATIGAQSLFKLIASVAIGFIVYCGCTWLFGFFDAGERHLLAGLVRRPSAS